MGRIVKACNAYGEHEAILIQLALSEAGIPSILHRNEIPMKAGYTFGCLSWAEIYVKSVDQHLIHDALASLPLKNEDGDCAQHYWPPYISLKSNQAIAWAYVFLTFILPALLAITGMTNLHGLEWVVLWVLIATPIFLTCCLLVLNWGRLSGTVREALLGLAALLPVGIILLVELAKLLFRAAKLFWRGFTYLMSNKD